MHYSDLDPNKEHNINNPNILKNIAVEPNFTVQDTKKDKQTDIEIKNFTQKSVNADIQKSDL